MKKIAIATVVVALASVVQIAGALPRPPACCACIEESGQVMNRTAADAAFCAAGEPAALEDRCAILTNGTGDFLCVNQTIGSSEPCRAQPAEGGIVCPSAGVPAAAPLNLATLAVVLGAAGSVLLRRRSRPRA